MDYAWLNIGSILFGLSAIALPFFCLAAQSPKKSFLFSFLSMLFCLIAVYMQYAYDCHLIAIGDWSALMDTQPSLLHVAGALILVTALLNWLISFKMPK